MLKALMNASEPVSQSHLDSGSLGCSPTTIVISSCEIGFSSQNQLSPASVSSLPSDEGISEEASPDVLDEVKQSSPPSPPLSTSTTPSTTTSCSTPDGLKESSEAIGKKCESLENEFTIHSPISPLNILQRALQESANVSLCPPSII